MFLSVIVPAYNSKDFLGETLSSIFIQSYKGLEVIVVDNGSSDGTGGFIKENYPEVMLITNTENKGTSFARNQGLKKAKGKWIIFMDADTILKDGFFAELKAIIDNVDNGVCAIIPKVIDEKGDIFSLGLHLSSICRSYNIEKEENISKVLGPNTCCSIYCRNVLDEIAEKGKVFDEEFFFLWEDMDLAYRLHKAGCKYLYASQLVCIHKQHSAPLDKDCRRYLHFSGRIKFIAKHYKGLKRLALLIRSFFYDILRTLHFFVFNKYRKKALEDLSILFAK